MIQDAREARDAALHAIGQELRANREVLPSFADDPSRPVRRQIYPRLHLSAVDAAFAEGSLSSVRDADLLGDLHAWRNQVIRFDSQLALASDSGH